MQRCWRMPPFTTFSSHVIGTLLAKLGSEDAGSAGVRCIRPIIGASRAAASVVWVPSMIGALACAAHATGAARARHRPRFLGPKVYLAATIILMAVLHEGATPARMRRLNELVGVDRRTVGRWRIFWRLLTASNIRHPIDGRRLYHKRHTTTDRPNDRAPRIATRCNLEGSHGGRFCAGTKAHGSSGHRKGMIRLVVARALEPLACALVPTAHQSDLLPRRCQAIAPAPFPGPDWWS